MKLNKWIVPGVIVLALVGGSISGCATLEDGSQGVVAVEDMTELQFNKWKLYTTLGAKIGAERLLLEGFATEEELGLAAQAIEAVIQDSADPLVLSPDGIFGPVLADVGLTNSEIELVILIVEQELLSRGALGQVDPTTGIINMSDRTKELLGALANSLREATTTDEEIETGKMLDEELSSSMINDMLSVGSPYEPIHGHPESN